MSVCVIEGAGTPGGGCRTEELTLPGFQHDVCSAVHPLAAASPFFAALTQAAAPLGGTGLGGGGLAGPGLAARGFRLLTPRVAFAHPLDGGGAAAVAGSVQETAARLGPDADAYRRLLGPLVRELPLTLPYILAPLRSLPAHPVAMARFGRSGVLPASMIARRFRTRQARALLAGTAAHAMLPLTAPVTSGVGLLLLMTAHAVGWPVAEGGSAAITGALVAELISLGGQLETGRWVRSLDSLPPARAVLLDVGPRQLAALAGDALPARARRAAGRFRYGLGVCKVDWALSGPVPWTAPVCREAGTVHVGGSFAEVARSEAEANAGRHPERPFCLIAQPGVVDSSRAPGLNQTLWGYCHVPSGSAADMSGRIEAQIERFAPGFRDLILARAVRTAAEMEIYNPNYIGGDVNGGAGTLLQTVLRPGARWNPYRTALPGVYLCSASTPPGGGVHGMCGQGAARTVLADLAGRQRAHR